MVFLLHIRSYKVSSLSVAAQVIGQGVVDVFKPYFKDMVVNFLPGGHAIFEDNQNGVVDALTRFAQSVTVHVGSFRLFHCDMICLIFWVLETSQALNFNPDVTAAVHCSTSTPHREPCLTFELILIPL